MFFAFFYLFYSNVCLTTSMLPDLLVLNDLCVQYLARLDKK